MRFGRSEDRRTVASTENEFGQRAVHGRACWPGAGVLPSEKTSLRASKVDATIRKGPEVAAGEGEVDHLISDGGPGDPVKLVKEALTRRLRSSPGRESRPFILQASRERRMDRSTRDKSGSFLIGLLVDDSYQRFPRNLAPPPGERYLGMDFMDYTSWLLDIGARNEPLEAILKLLKTGEDEDIPPLVPDEYSEQRF
ncbi:hypothetical protein B0H14DRAFT_2574822 [Mycena olivaceomarginata]|nr:hypothetical protein B0H14DRAFT_2574822 [Mycena olivaceomarginata]